MYKFQWSGKNQFGKRADAVRELKVHLKRLAKDKTVFVVAHSHGGNVAWDAAQDVNGVDAVIALATPFLHVREIPKEYSPFFTLLLFSAIYTGIYGLAVLFRQHLPFFFQIIFAFGPISLALLIIHRLFWQRALTSIPLRSATPPVLCCLRLPSDEAGLVLSLAESCYRAARQFFRMIFEVGLSVGGKIDEGAHSAERIVKAGLWSGAIIAIALGIASLFPQVPRDLIGFGAIALVVPAYMLAFGIVAVIGANLLTVLVLAVQAALFFIIPVSYVILALLLGLAFGWRLGPHCIRLQVSAEAAPSEVETRLEVFADSGWIASGGGISHFLQNHPSVIERCVEFLAHRQSQTTTSQSLITSKRVDVLVASANGLSRHPDECSRAVTSNRD